MTSPPTVLHSSGPLDRLAAFLAAKDLYRAAIRLIALNNGFILISLLYMIFIPDSSLGVFRPLQEDTNIPRSILIGVIAFLVYMDICQSFRGLVVTREMGWSVIGQGVIAIIALVYTMTGDLSTIALYGHGGVFLLSILLIVSAVQARETKAREEALKNGTEGRTEPQYPAKRLMLPVLSLLLFLLGWGLITRPDTAISQFIQTQYGLVFYVLLIAIVGWGSGQLRRNHFAAERMARRLTGVYLFAVFSVGLFLSGDGSSLLGVFMALLMAGLCMLIPLIHASERAV